MKRIYNINEINIGDFIFLYDNKLNEYIHIFGIAQFKEHMKHSEENLHIFDTYLINMFSNDKRLINITETSLKYRGNKFRMDNDEFTFNGNTITYKVWKLDNLEVLTHLVANYV